MHFDELVLGHVEAVPQLPGRLERLLEVVDQLRGRGARGGLLALLVVFVLLPCKGRNGQGWGGGVTGREGNAGGKTMDESINHAIHETTNQCMNNQSMITLSIHYVINYSTTSN